MEAGWRARVSNGFAIGGLLLASVLAPGRAGAAPAVSPPTFTVNSLADVAAATPLDNGVCKTAYNNNTCTLRAAIMKANHWLGGGVTIDLPAGTYYLTIAPIGGDDEASGDLNISNTLTLVGAGAATTIIDANQLDRVIDVGTGAAATVSNVMLRGGLVNHNDTILNDSGGGLRNLGNLILAGVVISGNQTTGPVTAGGGLGNFGTLTMNHSAVGDNQTSGDGGGIYNVSALTLIASLISDNQSSGSGGGIFNYGGALTAINSTISNNSAIGYGGGLLHTYFGSVNAYFTTIAGNLADSAATGAGSGGGISNGNSAPSHSPHLWKTLVADNYSGNTLSDCDADPLISEDYNYFETVAGCTITRAPGVIHDITGGDPRLDSLADNGGPTPARALRAGSPALDVIPANQCLDEFGAPLTTDQRGFARPANGQCDIGAYEGSLPGVGFLRNLVRNGDAEAAAGSPSGAFVGVPNWTTAGQLMTVVPYNAPGGFPAVPTDTVPANHGENFFAGGNSGVAGGTQNLDLSTLAAFIDSGDVSYDFSADLGGYADDGDNAQVEADFRDGTNQLLTQSFVGPVSAADRGNQTGLLHRAVTGLVPAGTRSVQLFVTLTRAAGSFNDGYADNISLVLLPRPLFLPLVRR